MEVGTSKSVNRSEMIRQNFLPVKQGDYLMNNLLQSIVDETNKAIRIERGSSRCCILASYAIRYVLHQLECFENVNVLREHQVWRNIANENYQIAKELIDRTLNERSA
jgi:hypothetical protein